MPYVVRRFQETPNPNALKCVLDRPISANPRSFRTPAEGAQDPLAAPLFAVPGVVGLLFSGDWVTVSKSPSADWKSVRQGVERALGALP